MTIGGGPRPGPPAWVAGACAAVLAAAAAGLPPAAATGGVYHVTVAGLSEGAGDPTRDPGAARLEVAATVASADGGERSGTAHVTLAVERPGEDRTYRFDDLAWSGAVEEAGPAGEPRRVTVSVEDSQDGGYILDLAAEAGAGGPGLTSTAAWAVRERSCTDHDDGFHDHAGTAHCTVTTVEEGRGAGVGTAG